MKPSTPDRIGAALSWSTKHRAKTGSAIAALRSVPHGDWEEIRALMLQEAADADLRPKHAAWLLHTAELLADPQDYIGLLDVMEPQDLFSELMSLHIFTTHR